MGPVTHYSNYLRLSVHELREDRQTDGQTSRRATLNAFPLMGQGHE